MPPSLPKLRSDLVVQRQRTAGGWVWVAKHPVTGSFFSLGDLEQFIAGQCDGATPLERIRQRAEERFGGHMAPRALDQFVRRLEKAGLLESGEATPPPPPRRVRGGLLHLRLPVVNPDRFLSRWRPHVRFLFTPGFVALSAVIILAGAVLVTAHADDALADLGRLKRLSAIPMIWLTVWSLVAAHELAHGFACKHFGGEVRELGLMLIYFQPAAYCNTSDAWLFPQRSRRIWVSLAGPWFELFLWGLAVLAWRALDPSVWLSDIALIVVVTSGIKTLFNLVPLLKLDGYYALSDALEMPNLRARAFRYVGRGIRRLLGFATGAAEPLTVRERRALLAYGTIASVFSLAFLLVALRQLGSFMDRDQPVLFALALGFLGLRLPRKLGRLFWHSAAPDEDPDSGESTATGAGGRPGTPAARSRNGAGMSPRTAAFALVAALATATAAFGRMELAVRGPFDVMPVRRAEVCASTDGVVESVEVEEGETVREGQIVARLSAPDVLSELDQIEARIEQGQARLRLLAAGPTAGERQVARAAVARAESQLAYDRRRVAIDQKLFGIGATSRLELEASEQRVRTSQHDLAQARGRLAQVLGGARAEEIEGTEAELRGLEAQRRHLEQKRERLNVRSPMAGVIATPALRLRQIEHHRVVAGDPIAEVHDTGAITAVMAIPEREIGEVRVGQPVTLRARAWPDVSFRGTVTAVGAAARGGPDASADAPQGAGAPLSPGQASRSVLVTTTIDNRGHLLKPQMTGQAKIMCGERRVSDLIGRGMARMFKVELWSWL